MNLENILLAAVGAKSFRFAHNSWGTMHHKGTWKVTIY